MSFLSIFLHLYHVILEYLFTVFFILVYFSTLKLCYSCLFFHTYIMLFLSIFLQLHHVILVYFFTVLFDSCLFYYTYVPSVPRLFFYTCFKLFLSIFLHLLYIILVYFSTLTSCYSCLFFHTYFTSFLNKNYMPKKINFI